jgi:hypothetical protein
MRVVTGEKLHVNEHLRHVFWNFTKQIGELLLNVFLQLAKLFVEENYFALIKNENTCLLILEDAALLFALNNVTFFLNE